MLKILFITIGKENKRDLLWNKSLNYQINQWLNKVENSVNQTPPAPSVTVGYHGNFSDMEMSAPRFEFGCDRW